MAVVGGLIVALVTTYLLPWAWTNYPSPPPRGIYESEKLILPLDPVSFMLPEISERQLFSPFSNFIPLSEAGRNEEVLKNAEEDLAIRRELVVSNRNAYLPDLARSLSSFSIFLSKAGHHAEALENAEEALAIYQELATVNHDAYLPYLERSLGYFSFCLNAVGRHEEAKKIAEEAANLRR